MRYLLLILLAACTQTPANRYNPQTGELIARRCFSILGTYGYHVQCRNKTHVGQGVFRLSDCIWSGPIKDPTPMQSDIDNAVNIIEEDCWQ